MFSLCISFPKLSSFLFCLGEKPCEYDKAGQELHKLLKKKRVAHTTRDERVPSDVRKPAPKTEQPAKPAIEPAREAPPWIKKSGASKEFKPDIGEEVQETYSGIKIVKPLLSYDQLRYRMESRRHIPLSNLHLKVNTSALESDWVTVAVIVAKSEPKMSSKGKQYSTWTLSDLVDCDKVVNFFLFGQTHQALWKTSQGSVIGVLNPQIMSNAEKYQKKQANQVSFMCLDPKQVMMMGTSKELGFCKATAKSGRPCTNFLNKSKGEYCTYHVQAMYKKVSAKRSDLQSGFTGVPPRKLEERIFGKGKNQAVVNYGGQTFTSAPAESRSNRGRKAVSITSLQQHACKPELKGKVTTLQLHSLLPEDAKTLREVQAAGQVKEKEKIFHELLTTPTPGAMNFVKHMMKKENNSVGEKHAAAKSMVSISAKDLLKQHEAAMKQKREAAKRSATTASASSPSLPKVPKLGRGMEPGGDIDLDSPVDFKAERAKAMALYKLKKKGETLQKRDPNAVKSSKSKDKQERVRKRAEESAVRESEKTTEEPAKKKSRLLGDLDLENPEVQRVLKANSAHAGQLSKEEQERQDQYFDVLEKKEQMEEKMIATKSIAMKAVACKQVIVPFITLCLSLLPRTFVLFIQICLPHVDLHLVYLLLHTYVEYLPAPLV